MDKRIFRCLQDLLVRAFCGAESRITSYPLQDLNSGKIFLVNRLGTRTKTRMKIFLEENQQSPFDLSSLGEMLRYPALMSVAVLTGYPFCCLIFSSSWDAFSRYKKWVFSAAVGGGLTVIGWSIIVCIGYTRPEYSSLIEGNEVILTTALLLLIAMAEVVLVAIIRFARICRLRRKRTNK